MIIFPSFTGLQTRRGLSWLLVLAVFGVAAVAAVIINSLGLRADAARRGEITLSRLEQKAYQLNALEWEALQKGKLGEELSESVAKARREMQEQVQILGGLGFELPQMAEVRARYAVYLKWVDEEFRLLGVGEVAEAEELDEARVDPAFEELSESMSEASGAFNQTASLALGWVRRWTFVVLLAAAGVAGLLFWKFFDQRRAAVVAAAEQRVLRRTNEELEARVRERTEELVTLNRQIALAARQAGMAEVANSVLHNVGNALNSVTVSISIILDQLKQSQLSDLPIAARLLQDHAHELGVFLTQHETGKQFPVFLRALAAQWQTEQAALTREAGELHRHIQHICEIIQRQQSISGVSAVIEDVSVAESVEHALALNEELLVCHRVQVRLEIPSGLMVQADRSKLTQILVNLVRNAAQALGGSGIQAGEIAVRAEPTADGRVLIRVVDNGPGITAENLPQLFVYGFTTKKSGHGFGLHGSALGAREMRGTLCAQSDGLGRGATFTLELPGANPVASRRAA